MDADISKITDNLEYMFARRLIDALRGEEASVEDARQYAKDFLAIEPFSSLEDARVKMSGYAEKHEMFKGLMEYLESYHEEAKKDEKIAAIREHMKSNNIEEALKVAGE